MGWVLCPKFGTPFNFLVVSGTHRGPSRAEWGYGRDEASADTGFLRGDRDKFHRPQLFGAGAKAEAAGDKPRAYVVLRLRRGDSEQSPYAAALSIASTNAASG
jgi:hypothetical protein